ncbi:inorganic triphosphatase YgiF, contains CYTH and CHAD domains [Nitrosomonas sp. PY1]|uniref:CYTH and CHAD domain-containing protein n=1 Tax=Nitrosomonas sp. PY1 TaxID=1803906 RepID=UPI001FC81E7F|nr:CYTH and CHAD domain-containing protein [Nitrosomonas sp. PY1]GKS68068.1 inorganic triphosphatase YgiF, contains CYTH and CHAD domains [Nitrosomonas sp. PY1]
MEIELKLALHPRHISRILDASLLRKIKPQRQHLRSIYFDTDTFQLKQRGIALRIRRIGKKRWIQTLKAEAQSTGTLTYRPEWEAVVKNDTHPDFTVLSKEAIDLLAGIELEQVAPVFVTEFKRTTWFLKNADNQVEIALDTGAITANDLQQEVCEVEFELKSGPAEFLFDLAEQLLQQVPLFVEPQSKAARGYLLVGANTIKPIKASPILFHADQSITDIYCCIIATALKQLLANMPGYFRHIDNPEYLHQIRVALRRIRSGLALLQSTKQPIAIPWNKSLRKIMQELNEARDWDVFEHEILPDLSKKITSIPGHEPIQQATLTAIHDIAIKIRQRTHKKLHHVEFTALILAIERHLIALPSHAEIMAKEHIQQWAAKILEDRWQALHQCCQSLTTQTAPERHQARIAAKKMRYAADTLFSLFNCKNPQRFTKMLADLQDELGYTNDRRVSSRLLQQLAQKIGPVAFDLGRLSGVLEIETLQREHKPSDAWRSLSRMKLFWRTT